MDGGLDGRPPAGELHLSAEDVLWSGLGVPLRGPEADDAQVGVDALEQARGGPGVASPGGVDLFPSGVGQRYQVEKSA